jgi:hypothetical protein
MASKHPEEELERIAESLPKGVEAEPLPHPTERNVMICNWVCMKLWDEAKTFTDVAVLNRLYLAGKLGQSPNCLGRIDEETALLKPSLQKLCAHNDVITIQSQPSVSSDTQEQRGFLDCFVRIPYVSAYAIVKALHNSDLDYVVADNKGVWSARSSGLAPSISKP